MILFFDEDMGTSIPKALRSVGLKTVLWKNRRYGTKERIEDTTWLSDAGRLNWLVFSKNTEILNVDPERDAIRDEKVGIVFLTTGQEKMAATLRLILNKWD